MGLSRLLEEESHPAKDWLYIVENKKRTLAVSSVFWQDLIWMSGGVAFVASMTLSKSAFLFHANTFD
ncbi:hypothetical protein KCV01_g57, partial [Aureobasidium melanogenum]